MTVYLMCTQDPINHQNNYAHGIFRRAYTKFTIMRNTATSVLFTTYLTIAHTCTMFHTMTNKNKQSDRLQP